MGILDRIRGLVGNSSSQTYTRSELNQRAREKGEMSVMPVENPVERLKAVHPEMPELGDSTGRYVNSHLCHPDADITFYPIGFQDEEGNLVPEDGEMFPLILSIEDQQEVPFVVYSHDSYGIPEGAVLNGAHEGSLLATEWGEALVIPCSLIHPDVKDAFTDENFIPIPAEMQGRTIPAQEVDSDERETLKAIASAGVVHFTQDL